MEVQVDYVSVAEAKSSLSNLIDQTVKSHTPVVIAGETHQAVLVSLDDWKAMQETLYLMSIPGMKDSILEGGQVPISECTPLEELEW